MANSSNLIPTAYWVILHLLKGGKKVRMNLCGTIILFSLAPLLCLAQNPDGKTSRKEPPSDRVRFGLRGPVKTCVEETTYPAVTASDGTQFPERTVRIETEYDQEGRVVSTRNRNPDGSAWMIRNTYASGKLLKTTWGKEGEPPGVTSYAYDDQGRLTSITESSAPDNPTTFHYDERGRKTKVQKSRAEDYRPNIGIAGSPMQAADMRPNLPGGGTATTTYDENDRSTEVRIRDAQGAEVSRAVRVYDEQGHITEEKQILDDPLNLIPADARAAILADSGASGADLREQLKKIMGGHEGASSEAYSYDAQDRVKETRRRIFNKDETIETTYNEQGDAAAETTRSLPGSNEQEPTWPGENSEVRYSYQYDEHGNWTEKITSYSSDPGSTFQTSDTARRTLTYF
jgi:YD repeat-containing protein